MKFLVLFLAIALVAAQTDSTSKKSGSKGSKSGSTATSNPFGASLRVDDAAGSGMVPDDMIFSIYMDGKVPDECVGIAPEKDAPASCCEKGMQMPFSVIFPDFSKMSCPATDFGGSRIQAYLGCDGGQVTFAEGCYQPEWFIPAGVDLATVGSNPQSAAECGCYSTSKGPGCRAVNSPADVGKMLGVDALKSVPMKSFGKFGQCRPAHAGSKKQNKKGGWSNAFGSSLRAEDTPTDGPTDRPTDGPTDRPTDGPTDAPAVTNIALPTAAATAPAADAKLPAGYPPAGTVLTGRWASFARPWSAAAPAFAGVPAALPYTSWVRPAAATSTAAAATTTLPAAPAWSMPYSTFGSSFAPAVRATVASTASAVRSTVAPANVIGTSMYAAGPVAASRPFSTSAPWQSGSFGAFGQRFQG